MTEGAAEVHAMTSAGDFSEVHPDATLLKRWVVVRRLDPDRLNIVRSVHATWTEGGAREVQARLFRRYQERSQWDLERGVEPTVERFDVLDMWEHPSRPPRKKDERLRFW